MLLTFICFKVLYIQYIYESMDNVLYANTITCIFSLAFYQC